MSKRIYLLKYTEHNKDQRNRLVRATSPAQAMKHATKDLFTVAVAEPEELVNLCSNGTKVEDASEE